MIALERLLIKLRQPPSRASELIELRGRLRAEIASKPEDHERELARAILAQKLRVAALLHDVRSCASCETEHAFGGGACCGGVTSSIFDDTELAALAHAGTRVDHLVAPRTEHAGCAFRGSTGCTLETAHRPARCVHYACTTLRRELHARGELDALEAALAALDRLVQELRVVHAARADRDVLEPIFDAIARLTLREQHDERDRE
jgi:hypothetical protein